jgi:uracil DNA glycosylase
LTETAMIDLTHYRNFLSEKAFHVINTALEESKKEIIIWG